MHFPFYVQDTTLQCYVIISCSVKAVMLRDVVLEYCLVSWDTLCCVVKSSGAVLCCVILLFPILMI